MHEWRVWFPLTTEAEPKVDIALLLGHSVDVDTIEEVVLPLTPRATPLSLRAASASLFPRRRLVRTHTLPSPTRPRAPQEHFLLGHSIDLRWSRHASGEQVLQLRLLAGTAHTQSVECWAARPKLRLHAGVPSLAHGAAREWLRAQAEACEPEARRLLLDASRGGEARRVRLRRRQLRSCLPGERGVMLEQSDVSYGDRLWRSILVEASSPQVCRRAALELRHRFAPGGLVVSTPGFVRMLSCTEARGAARPRAGGEAAAPTRYVLSDVLTQQWRQQKEGYTPRVWRDAQDRETAPHALPLPGADLLLESRKQLPYLRAGGPLRSAASEATPPTEGTLDMFPESVVKATLTDAASRGDEQLLRQLLSLDGIRVDCRCGREANGLDTPLHVAARAGNTAIVRQLLRSHADISILTNGGRTPLHTAALGGRADRK
ncbi:hypothetical protein AB1Y20_017119 [Prymnesium parvum]|uniref:Uncharacterized protein n=1 Tax=Prymnesium parvum TaxID=97485 RepID=A0AB34ICF6_PRYPA